MIGDWAKLTVADFQDLTEAAKATRGFEIKALTEGCGLITPEH